MEVKNNRVAIYVPDVESTISGMPMKSELDFLCRRMTQMFGGVTVTKAKGYYESVNFDIMKDNLFILTSFAKDVDFDRHISYIKEIIVPCLRDRLAEECIMLEINGVAYLI